MNRWQYLRTYSALAGAGALINYAKKAKYFEPSDEMFYPRTTRLSRVRKSPWRRRRYRKRRKKKYPKRRYKRRRFPMLRRPPAPRRMFVRFRTYAIGEKVSGDATSEHIMWIPSSCFNPFGTMDSEQPRGFDQLSPIFDRVKVYKSRCKVWFNNSKNTSTRMLVHYGRTANLATEWVDKINQPNTRWTMVPANNATSSTDINGKLYMYKSHRRIFGKRIIENEYGGTFTASPTTNCYFHIFLQTIDETAYVQYRILGRIDQWAVLFQPDILDQS